MFENTARLVLSSWCWTIEELISSHGSDHHPALLFYLKIRRTSSLHILGLLPSLVKSFYSSSSSSSPLLCKTLHSDSLKLGAVSDTKVATSLLTFYSSCGLLLDSHNLFYSTPYKKTTPIFNAMIASYILNNHPLSALSLFSQMVSTHNLPPPTPTTCLHIISSFSKSHNPTAARLFFDSLPPPLKTTLLLLTAMIHCHTSNSQMEAAQQLFQTTIPKTPFLFSSMIAGYFNIPQIQKAEHIFRNIPNKTLVNWNCMLSGYLRNGYPVKALDTFSRMRRQGLNGDETTLVCALSSCAAMGRLDLGRQVHRMVVVNQEGICINKYIACALVDMYGKCGDLKTAEYIFWRMGSRYTECWNAIIGAKGWHGRAGDAVEMLEMMGEDADAVSFVAALSGCAHGGLLEEALGERVWGRMKRTGVVSVVEHYGCVVDMLGRGGELGLGSLLLKRLRGVGLGNSVVSSSLVGASSLHSRRRMGFLEDAMAAGFSVLVPTYS